ncbi:MAG: trypsin-like peptidase domain-containing protein [Candidatus Paceibacterota bacterium]|jgi:hypothetical protein
MFRNRALIILFILFSTFIFISSPSNSNASNNVLIQKQIKILLLKIQILRSELAKLKLAEAKVAPLAQLDIETLNTSVRKAVVNILCENQSNSPFKSISGSGVIIDSRGVILTNAHIGQYFLVKDYPTQNSMSCVIRTGSPALPAYYAQLMYLPPMWIQNNPTTMKTSGATGTGENDYALLAITDSANTTPLPASFSSISIDDTFTSLADNYPALLVSYPGELVGSFIIKNSLSMSSAVSNIKQGYYFDGDTDHNLDLLDVSGTVISQAGSSGGAAVSLLTGKLIGLITTATEAKTTDIRELRAITLAHINRSITKYTSQSLDAFLTQSPISAAVNFETSTASTERAILIQ